ncbi:MAG TPA: hypothetical protein VK789_02045 [Bryobacteraceae bacterium]|jgi:hypothetical protein|nr:hypothetical protein [Bryobacteraceae bacterium]
MNRLTIATFASAALALLLVLPAVAADNARNHQEKGAWPPETISGTINMVEPGQKIVVVKSDNVPFDMVITSKTHIMHGSQAVSMNDLSQYQNKSVSVRFIPEGRGDIAQSIQING